VLCHRPVRRGPGLVRRHDGTADRRRGHARVGRRAPDRLHRPAVAVAGPEPVPHGGLPRPGRGDPGAQGGSVRLRVRAVRHVSASGWQFASASADVGCGCLWPKRRPRDRFGCGESGYACWVESIDQARWSLDQVVEAYEPVPQLRFRCKDWSLDYLPVGPVERQTASEPPPPNERGLLLTPNSSQRT